MRWTVSVYRGFDCTPFLDKTMNGLQRQSLGRRQLLPHLVASLASGQPSASLDAAGGVSAAICRLAELCGIDDVARLPAVIEEACGYTAVSPGATGATLVEVLPWSAVLECFLTWSPALECFLTSFSCLEPPWRSVGSPAGWSCWPTLE